MNQPVSFVILLIVHKKILNNCIHYFSNLIPEDDLHYKSFEELYDIQISENHRPSFVNAKVKVKKGKTKITRTKHTMPFCPSAIHAKNVGIIINCTECEKPCLLFSAKKLSEKNKTILREFLNTIFYTCGISFYDTCDLAMTILPKQHEDTKNDISHDKEADNQENMDKEDKNEQFESENTDNEKSDSTIEEKSDNNAEDSICELFSRVFINDLWSYTSQVKKLYYSTGIYPDACIECGNLEVSKPAKGEHSRCSDCNDNTANSKKCSKWMQGNKDKRKHMKI